MAIPSKISRFLEKAEVKYEPIKHRTVYTAHDKAATLKTPEKIVGKTLLVKLDKELGLVLIPANKNLDKNKLKKSAGIRKIDFASETIIKNKMKGVKLGAVPPFGPVWKMPVFVDNSLLKAPKIIVNSGDHKFSFRISGPALKKLMPELIKGSFGKARK